ncbi:MAG: S8 family peptidase [Cytophagales bacterium]|nr:MAG: S8 family peptidase [Cytophagales bacterium]
MPRSLSAACFNAALFLLPLTACQSDDDVDLGPAADCLVKASARNGEIIEGSYIVTYAPDVALPNAPNARVAAQTPLVAVEQMLRLNRVEAEAVTVLGTGPETMFSATLSPSDLARLQQDPAVLSVEQDQIMSICNCVDVATTATLSWNISGTGFGRGDRQNGKTVWVIDTGIDLDHPDLNVDRNRSISFLTGKTADDESGHGTHVAGIIGALNNGFGVTGIASGATLVSLRVLDAEGDGKVSTILQAINHVFRNGQPGDVVNMSLGGEGVSSSLERAIRQTADRGIFFTIAAGNEKMAVAGLSPARVDHRNVFTVSAMDRNEQYASFSNYGPEVDICAYGVRIPSTYKDGRYATLSGTSMAAPHVAGLLYIRGASLPTRGYVKNDPDGKADAIARE